MCALCVSTLFVYAFECINYGPCVISTVNSNIFSDLVFICIFFSCSGSVFCRVYKPAHLRVDRIPQQTNGLCYACHMHILNMVCEYTLCALLV